MKCDDYYLLFQEKSEVTPTAVKSWVKYYSGIENKRKKLFQNIPHFSAHNNFSFKFPLKILHCILVTKKGLRSFKISDSEDCFFCKSPDSLENAFLDCPAGRQASFKNCLYGSIMNKELTIHHLKYSYY